LPCWPLLRHGGPAASRSWGCVERHPHAWLRRIPRQPPAPLFCGGVDQPWWPLVAASCSAWGRLPGCWPATPARWLLDAHGAAELPLTQDSIAPGRLSCAARGRRRWEPGAGGKGRRPFGDRRVKGWHLNSQFSNWRLPTPPTGFDSTFELLWQRGEKGKELAVARPSGGRWRPGWLIDFFADEGLRSSRVAGSFGLPQRAGSRHQPACRVANESALAVIARRRWLWRSGSGCFLRLVGAIAARTQRSDPAQWLLVADAAAPVVWWRTGFAICRPSRPAPLGAGFCQQ